MICRHMLRALPSELSVKAPPPQCPRLRYRHIPPPFRRSLPSGSSAPAPRTSAPLLPQLSTPPLPTPLLCTPPPPPSAFNAPTCRVISPSAAPINTPTDSPPPLAHADPLSLHPTPYCQSSNPPTPPPAGSSAPAPPTPAALVANSPPPNRPCCPQTPCQTPLAPPPTHPPSRSPPAPTCRVVSPSAAPMLGIVQHIGGAALLRAAVALGLLHRCGAVTAAAAAGAAEHGEPLGRKGRVCGVGHVKSVWTTPLS